MKGIIRFAFAVSMMTLFVGCASQFTPSHPLPKSFVGMSRHQDFADLVRWRINNDHKLWRQMWAYRVPEWERVIGGDYVFHLPYHAEAEMAKHALDKMLVVFCRERGLGKPGPIDVPLFPVDNSDGMTTAGTFSGTYKKAVGCGTDNKILAAYLFDVDGYLRVYGETDSVAVYERRRVKRDAAREAQFAKQRRLHEQETRRIRRHPRLNELVTVNLAAPNLEEMPGYKLMDVRVANSGIAFQGRIREIKPPMVLVNESALVNFPFVWVPMDSLEAPPETWSNQ